MTYFILFLLLCVVVGVLLQNRPMRQRYFVLGFLCLLICIAFFLGKL